MNENRKQLDAYERWVAYLLVATFLCLGFLSWRGRQESVIGSTESVHRERMLNDRKKENKSFVKGVKSDKQKKRGRLLVKKEAV